MVVDPVGPDTLHLIVIIQVKLALFYLPGSGIGVGYSVLANGIGTVPTVLGNIGERGLFEQFEIFPGGKRPCRPPVFKQDFPVSGDCGMLGEIGHRVVAADRARIVGKRTLFDTCTPCAE